MRANQKYCDRCKTIMHEFISNYNFWDKNLFKLSEDRKLDFIILFSNSLKCDRCKNDLIDTINYHITAVPSKLIHK